MFRRAGCGSAFRLKILVLCALTFPLAVAQDSSTGAVRGAVSDAAGARIRGATVAVVSVATGLRYFATSDGEGRFAVELLPPGDYLARAEAPGMSPQITPNLRVELGAATEIEFKLAVAGTKETVTVSGEPQWVETQASTVSSVIDERAIEELPMDGRRFTDLALLTGGVTQDPRGLMSSSNGDLAFGGIRGFQTSYLVDGADDNNAFFSQARGRYRAPYQFSNEVVQQFRVSSNTYGAELGRSGGAVVNVVTKSGSNHFHGTGFYYGQNSAFNAAPAFTGFNPRSQQHQFGFTLGGPIKPNRAFFFAGFDQHIFHVPTVVQFDDGSSAVTPQPGPGPVTPGDYEASDQALVFAAAAQLSKQAGAYPAKLVGNAGFLKVETAISPRHFLSLRINTSRYSGLNNVFLDPTSPLTTFGISDNGEEQVATESAAASLTSSLSFHLVSHLRAQFSRDLQQSSSNTSEPLTKITNIMDGFGRSSILPRQTREHRLHLAETLSLEAGRHSWKLGGDALLSWIYNFFPSLSGGEYIFDPIKVNPFTFAPQIGGLELTPLRAYAHQVPHYYVQNFGPFVTNPDTNEYAAFLQDSMRITEHFGLSLGARYDLQTFTKKGLVTNPLWPDSGKVPLDSNNVAPRVGLAYSLGDRKPLVIRAGYGLFYTRIPQIYNSAVQSENGLNGDFLFLNNTNYYAKQIFPQYPNALVTCAPSATVCTPPASLLQFVESDVSAFAHNFRTPEVHQASLSLEREMGARIAAGVSYTYVHGQDLIRARDVNLPPPVNVSYPVYDSSGLNLLGYDTVQSFSTWQMTTSATCPFPPCINPLARPIPQLGSIDVFESAASSTYNGMTVSINRRARGGLYFRLAYTFAHAIDDGQDALVAGQPATVQNSYAPNAEKGPSVTDQRHRFVFSWIASPRPFASDQPMLSTLFNNWKVSGIITLGSGRPVDARVIGDANQDGNSSNDRLPGVGRNSLVGPDYATTNMRLARTLHLGDRVKLDVMIESFNLFNRLNARVQTTADGFQNTLGQFVLVDKHIDFNYFPAYFQKTANPLKITSAYAPRQLQLALKLIF
ncbi:MAG TPA: TonB-dependent receptor [Terriglobales bacterium]|nr:TonB-dependent receptor [Terriglobales bacterium]